MNRVLREISRMLEAGYNRPLLFVLTHSDAKDAKEDIFRLSLFPRSTDPAAPSDGQWRIFDVPVVVAAVRASYAVGEDGEGQPMIRMLAL